MLRSVETEEGREKLTLNLYADHRDIGKSDTELKYVYMLISIEITHKSKSKV
jgi:hypothetical protein